MKIICLTVGKKHDKNFIIAINEYEKRLKSYVDFEFILLASGDISTETKSIIQNIQPQDHVILLDENGKSLTNQTLVSKIERLQNLGTKRLVFIIGGAYGVDKKLLNAANETYSLSGLVLPHQIVRLVLIEQLYRSFNYLAGGKYHHS